MVTVATSSAVHYVKGVGRKLRRTKDHLCIIFLKRLYHKYGLKHVVLIFCLLFYTFFGAFLFVIIEEPAERLEKLKWEKGLVKNRTIFVARLCKSLLNNSVYYLWATENASTMVSNHLTQRMEFYEKKLAVKFSPQKMEWNYPNAMLYAITIFTTIGYGHVYPKTKAGRVLTMVYAIVGIPLVLTILNDLGKLLTMGMKYPWFLTKKIFRRIKRLCFKTPMVDILKVEKEERENLQIFDLPIPLAISLVVGWIFACSATFMIWEKWDYLDAFYFFFISLSTIGLGDILPDRPDYLLMAFGYIIIGLSLVSMCVNLIQSRLEKTYQAGLRSQQATTPVDEQQPEFMIRPALGIIQAFSHALPNIEQLAETSSKITLIKNQSCQTDISFPSSKYVLMSDDGSMKLVTSEAEINNPLSFRKSSSFSNCTPSSMQLTRKSDLESSTLDDITEDMQMSSLTAL